MVQTLSYTGTLVITSCWCGIHMALPADLMKMAEHNGKAVFCPLGHEWVVKKTEAEVLRDKLESAQREVIRQRNWRQEAEQDLENERRSKAAVKGHLTRLRNKIAAGICPVDDCRRNFANVAGHISRMHPDWASAHPEALK